MTASERWPRVGAQRAARLAPGAARPATLPAAVVPVLVGTGSRCTPRTPLNLPVFVPTLLAALLIQIGTNFANDVFDFRRGADTAERLGPLRVTQGGLVTPQQVLTATFVTFGLALLIGIYLVSVGGWPILADRRLSACCQGCCTPAARGHLATTAWATWCAS